MTTFNIFGAQKNIAPATAADYSLRTVCNEPMSIQGAFQLSSSIIIKNIDLIRLIEVFILKIEHFN